MLGPVGGPSFQPPACSSLNSSCLGQCLASFPASQGAWKCSSCQALAAGEAVMCTWWSQPIQWGPGFEGGASRSCGKEVSKELLCNEAVPPFTSVAHARLPFEFLPMPCSCTRSLTNATTHRAWTSQLPNQDRSFCSPFPGLMRYCSRQPLKFSVPQLKT